MNIIAVVGPSGAGKDTLLRLASKELAENDDIVFLRRYITRKPDASEDNFFLDDYTFGFLKSRDFFVSSWQAHQNLYGIARHSFEQASPATTFICSVSRGAVADFEALCPQTATIEITARPEVVARRLRARGRESDAGIAHRLKRADRGVKALHLIRFDNSAPLEQSHPAFLRLLLSLHKPETVSG